MWKLAFCWEFGCFVIGYEEVCGLGFLIIPRCEQLSQHVGKRSDLVLIGESSRIFSSVGEKIGLESEGLSGGGDWGWGCLQMSSKTCFLSRPCYFLYLRWSVGPSCQVFSCRSKVRRIFETLKLSASSFTSLTYNLLSLNDKTCDNSRCGMMVKGCHRFWFSSYNCKSGTM